MHVLTGFLGSGKTTLLRNILRDSRYARTAVLINEWGEVGLDHLLLGAVPGEPVLLESGCICCTIRGDLAQALADLHRRAGAGTMPAFERVVIETTGLADPTPVMATLLADLVVRRAFRPGRLIATLDAVHAPAGLQAHPVLRKQAAVADAIVLTKHDLAGPADALRRELRTLNPLAAIVSADFGVIDPAMLFDAPIGAQDWIGLASDTVTHRNATSFCIELHEAIDYGAFALWFSLLVHRHGTRLLRVKALLDVAGSDVPVALHAIQHVIHPPEHLAVWTGPRRSLIVFITDGLTEPAVASSLAAFLRLAKPSEARAISQL